MLPKGKIRQLMDMYPSHFPGLKLLHELRVVLLGVAEAEVEVGAAHRIHPLADGPHFRHLRCMWETRLFPTFHPTVKALSDLYSQKMACLIIAEVVEKASHDHIG